MTADKSAIKRRILTKESLSDEHAYVAGMLLTLGSGDPLAYRVSTWVAQEIFEIDATEWHAALDALTAAGLVLVRWESLTRVTIIFVQEEQS